MAQPAGSAASSRPTAPPELIGRPGAPIRVLAFASGGFETVRQLGVAHALLVNRGGPPDMVIGGSAGAVNAVAVAEVLQAGDPAATPEACMAARVARFREIFEAYQNCPGELADAMLPDTYQIDVQRPLEQVRLPIHAEKERRKRGEHLQSRAGILNLYNDLLRLRISIATATRFIRRYLGWNAVGAETAWYRRWFARLLELLRAWVLVGYHLPELVPLAWPLVQSSFGKRFKTERGAPAAHLIFRSVWARSAWSATMFLFWLAVLVTCWTLLSTPVLLAGDAAGHLIAALLHRGDARLDLPGARLWAMWTLDHESLEQLARNLGHELGLAAVGIMSLTATVAGVSAWLRPTSRLAEFRGILGSAFGFVALYGLILAGTGLLLAAAASVGPAAAPPPLVIWAVRGLLVLVGGALAIGAIAIVVCGASGHLIRNLLKRYDLADGLGSNYPLRQFFVRLFDHEYYGRIPMDTVLERAMAYADKEHDAKRHRRGKVPGKRLEDYASASRPRPIHVAVTAADLGTDCQPGTPIVQVLPAETPVVDALLAATAVTPFLPPYRLKEGNRLFIDAANIANEPTGAALDYLRDAAHPDASSVYLYSVTHLPLTLAAMDERPERYAELLTVALRARQLERFRDARLDRNVTELFTATLPAGKVRYDTPKARFLRARIFPVEPERAAYVNERVLQAPRNTDRRRIIAETVADGCRTALESMIRGHAQEAADGKSQVGCRAAITRRLEVRRPGDPHPGIPGSSLRAEHGPGLVEVCQHCALYRGRKDEEAKCTLRVLRDATPEWPVEGASEPKIAAPAPTPPDQDPAPGRAWPVERKVRLEGSETTLAGYQRPTVSLLFSGGVFRGVYQMGALNALNEAGLKPDIIAGASIGAITAAMIARTFSEEDPRKRTARILRLAAVYLGVDRLVMTDRFADFIRAVTVRAAQTRFSIRDADCVFRRYDGPWFGVYERQARRVMAGLERLCYVSPFELKDLVEALRLQDSQKASRLARAYIQEWLNRLGVGNQMLGAEPLRLLITKYVLDQLEPQPGIPAGDATFDVFRQKGICLLATMTNLTAGRLDVLGQDQLDGGGRTELLVEGLLASSAFPAVFRPRWSWEVMPESRLMDRYVDGGVTDNLPLDAVAQFLHRAARTGWITRRPTVAGLAVPHLLLATSLEPQLRPLTNLEEMEDDWPRLWRRAQQLKYNIKLDSYAQAQWGLRSIVEQRGNLPAPFEPLDLEVLAVKPTWLCPTFGFHPMMGFRRRRQAQSIAHGCRSTLIELGRLYHAKPRMARWADGWGLRQGRLPGLEVVKGDPPPPRLAAAGPGDCWIRPGTPCPFSRKEAAKTLRESSDPGSRLRLPRTASELHQIYVLCGQAGTHLPAED